MCYYVGMKKINLTLPNGWVEIPTTLYNTYGITDLEELPVLGALKMGLSDNRICMIQDYGSNVSELIDEILDTNVNMDREPINDDVKKQINRDVNITNVCIENYRIGGVIPTIINVLKNDIGQVFYVIQIFVKHKNNLICFSTGNLNMDEKNPIQYILKDHSLNILINKVIPSMK